MSINQRRGNVTGRLLRYFAFTKETYLNTSTVKNGYNDHGHNEFTAITNKIWSIFGPN